MSNHELVTSEKTVGSKDWVRRVLAIHNQLVISLEWVHAGSDSGETNRMLPALIDRLVEGKSGDLDRELREQLKRDVLAETIGLGPLEPLLSDPAISDVLVNSPSEVFIEKQGRLIRTPYEFADSDHLMRIIQRVAARVGRRIDESSPMVDARLADGSRVHAVVPPLALKGPTLSIRRFGHCPLAIDDLISGGSLSQEMAQFLAAAVRSRISFLISGGTGAGKTTLLNAISSYIPNHERIVTIEDAGELKLQHPHVVSLEARPANTEGQGQITIRNLVRNSLRMRPDRILVGEVRGIEVIDMLQAMNTGHPGSMSTIHANDTKDALSRLEVMVGMSGYEFPIEVLRQYIASGIQLLVHVARLEGGVRRVTRIVEILGLKNGNYRLREIFGFRQTGIDSSGCVIGEFYATGYLPKFYRKSNPIKTPVVPTEATEIQIAPGRRVQMNVVSWSMTQSEETPMADEQPSAAGLMPPAVDVAEPDPRSIAADGQSVVQPLEHPTALNQSTILNEPIASPAAGTPIRILRNQSVQIQWDASQASRIESLPQELPSSDTGRMTVNEPDEPRVSSISVASNSTPQMPIESAESDLWGIQLAPLELPFASSVIDVVLGKGSDGLINLDSEPMQSTQTAPMQSQSSEESR